MSRRIYADLGVSFMLRSDERQHFVTLYRQPLLPRVVGALYHRWEKHTWRVLRYADRPLRRLHERRCDGCATMYASDGSPVRTCAYLPLCARQDLRCYDLNRRGRVDLVRLMVTPEQYRAATGREPV